MDYYATSQLKTRNQNMPNQTSSKNTVDDQVPYQFSFNANGPPTLNTNVTSSSSKKKSSSTVSGVFIKRSHPPKELNDQYSIFKSPTSGKKHDSAEAPSKQGLPLEQTKSPSSIGQADDEVDAGVDSFLIPQDFEIKRLHQVQAAEGSCETLEELQLSKITKVLHDNFPNVISTVEDENDDTRTVKQFKGFLPGPYNNLNVHKNESPTSGTRVEDHTKMEKKLASRKLNKESYLKRSSQKKEPITVRNQIIAMHQQSPQSYSANQIAVYHRQQKSGAASPGASVYVSGVAHASSTQQMANVSAIAQDATVTPFLNLPVPIADVPQPSLTEPIQNQSPRSLRQSPLGGRQHDSVASTSRSPSQHMSYSLHSSPAIIMKRRRKTRTSSMQSTKTFERAQAAQQPNRVSNQQLPAQMLANTSSPILSNKFVKEQYMGKAYHEMGITDPVTEREEYDSQQQTTSRESIELTKEVICQRLKQLFLNYCDFQVDSAKIYITQSQFQKLLKEAKVTSTEPDALVTPNAVSILCSTSLKIKNNLLKTISFEQFLDCVFGLSELKDPLLCKTNPKKALKKLITQHFLPLLHRIETKASKKKVKKGTVKQFSVNEAYQRQIIYNDDTVAIFTDIMPLMRSLYSSYFDHEMNSLKGSVKQSLKELRAQSLKSCIQFARDFGICPYMVSQRTCFLIWFSIQEQSLTKKSAAQSIINLANNPEQTQIMHSSLQLGKAFTLAHFVIFVFRIAIIQFDQSPQVEALQVKNFNLIKKLLYFLRQMESSDSLLKFIHKIGRTYTKTLSFLPSKDLLAQIIICEKLDRFISFGTISSIPKEHLVTRILDGDQYIEFEHQTSRLKTVSQQAELLQENEQGQVLEQHEDKIKQIFEIYCSIGEPMNTKTLKSSKLVKMMKDAGLIKVYSTLPKGLKGYAKQVTQTELDLLYTSVCTKLGHERAKEINKEANVIKDTNSVLGKDRSIIIEALNTNRSGTSTNRRNTSRVKSGVATRRNNAANGSMSSRNLMLPSHRANASHGGMSDFSMSGQTPRGDRSGFCEYQTINETSSRFGSKTPTRSHTSDKFDFPGFIKFLIVLGPKVFPGCESTQQSVLLFVEKFLLPLSKMLKDERSVQNTRISKLVNMVNSKELVDFMGELFYALQDTYSRYTEPQSHLMTFDNFLQFTKDHEIFPDLCSKAAIYRIFHSLSIMNEVMPNASVMSARTKLSMNQVSVMSPRGQAVAQSSQKEKIDENLFVEALTLCALYSENDKELNAVLASYDPFVHDEPSKNSIKVCLSRAIALVERMNDSHGVYARTVSNKVLGNAIKCNLQEKRDLIASFKKSNKFAWYFQEKKSIKRRFSPSRQKLNFNDVMGMDSFIEPSQTQNHSIVEEEEEPKAYDEEDTSTFV